MSLDEDEIDALAQAGAVVLRWIVLALGVLLIARVLVGCGGDQFTVSVFPDAGGALVDAGAASATLDSGAQETSRGEARAASDPPDSSTIGPDAGAGAQDAGAFDRPDMEPPDASTPPPHEAGPPPACEPSRCPMCAAALGYACCTGAGACGCENPSQGGACL